MTNGLTTRQHLLKTFLEENYKEGKFFTIEEIVNQVVDSSGEPVYKLNTNPYTHDKCIALSNDVKNINWNVCDGMKVIIKNEKGSIKIADNETEFNSWRDKELKKVEKKYQYLNNLKWKSNRDGTMEIINQHNNPVDYDKPQKPISVYGNEPNNFVGMKDND